MKRHAVVTGLGMVTSLSCKTEDLWEQVAEGHSGIHPLRVIDPSHHKVKIGGDIYDWNPIDYISPKDLKRLDPFTQFALVAAADAVSDSGLDFSAEDPWRCGVILGCGIGGLREMEWQVSRLFQKGPDRVSAMTIPKLMPNAASGNISIKYALQGPSYSISSACASAANAIGDALRTIQYGDADVVITGGTEAAMTQMGVSGFGNMKAVSMRNDDPAGASRPFDADRDGFVLSEGAGILVLEELEHAKRRGARIYGEVLGAGASSDGQHITRPDEDGIGAAKAMESALRNAQLDPEQVDYINAHGTGTPVGDIAETKAIKSVFGDHAWRMSISSTKSQLGHSLGASGGIELALSIMAVVRNVVPPTINLETPDPDCDLDYTPLQARDRDIKVAMSNSFGFGGHNASLIVGELRNGSV
jgi:3-oxoacyl-[acyl-carrier-protein] synthase II